MKHHIALFLVALGLHTAALASPSINGATGLIGMPTADTLRFQEYNLGIDYLLNTDSGVDDAHVYKLNLGTFEGWEFGVVGGSTPSEGAFINLKYSMIADSTQFPMSVAVGFENLTSNTQTMAYLVASKSFQGGFHGHFGFRALFNDKVDASIMTGVEYFMNDQVSFVSDFEGVGDNYDFNLGARYFLNDQVTLQLAGVNLFSKTDPTITFGLILSKFL